MIYSQSCRESRLKTVSMQPVCPPAYRRSIIPYRAMVQEWVDETFPDYRRNQTVGTAPNKPIKPHQVPRWIAHYLDVCDKEAKIDF